MAADTRGEDESPMTRDVLLEAGDLDEEEDSSVAADAVWEDDEDDEDDEDLDEPPFTIGDSVVVRAGERDPDFEDHEIGGWQGRVTGFHEEDPWLVDIAWDSVTLRGMSMEWMARSELEGLNWSRIYLEAGALEPAAPRDTEPEAEETWEALQSRVADELNATGNLYALGEQGKAVLALLDARPTRDERAVFETWHAYLQQALRLPFVAEVATRDHAPLHQGDRVTVRAITRLDDQDGTIVRVQGRRDTVELPLLDLRIATPSAANYPAVHAYTEWLENLKELDAPILLPPNSFLHL